MSNQTETTNATQIQHPWRATIRTLFAGIIAFAAMYPAIITAAGLPETAWVSASIALSAGITRVMALPAVNAFIAQFLPWLAPEKPAANTSGETTNADQ